jgi:hypothetical protein
VEVVGDLVLLLLGGVFVLFLNLSNDSLNILALFYVLEGLNGADAWNICCVVTSAQDTKVDELVLGHAKSS